MYQRSNSFTSTSGEVGESSLYFLPDDLIGDDDDEGEEGLLPLPSRRNARDEARRNVRSDAQGSKMFDSPFGPFVQQQETGIGNGGDMLGALEQPAPLPNLFEFLNEPDLSEEVGMLDSFSQLRPSAESFEPTSTRSSWEGIGFTSDLPNQYPQQDRYHHSPATLRPVDNPLYTPMPLPSFSSSNSSKGSFGTQTQRIERPSLESAFLQGVGDPLPPSQSLQDGGFSGTRPSRDSADHFATPSSQNKLSSVGYLTNHFQSARNLVSGALSNSIFQQRKQGSSPSDNFKIQLNTSTQQPSSSSRGANEDYNERGNGIYLKKPVQRGQKQQQSRSVETTMSSSNGNGSRGKSGWKNVGTVISGGWNKIIGTDTNNGGNSQARTSSQSTPTQKQNVFQTETHRRGVSARGSVSQNNKTSHAKQRTAQNHSKPRSQSMNQIQGQAVGQNRGDLKDPVAVSGKHGIVGIKESERERHERPPNVLNTTLESSAKSSRDLHTPKEGNPPKQKPKELGMESPLESKPTANHNPWAVLDSEDEGEQSNHSIFDGGESTVTSDEKDTKEVMNSHRSDGVGMETNHDEFMDRSTEDIESIAHAHDPSIPILEPKADVEKEPSFGEKHPPIEERDSRRRDSLASNLTSRPGSVDTHKKGRSKAKKRENKKSSASKSPHTSASSGRGNGEESKFDLVETGQAMEFEHVPKRRATFDSASLFRTFAGGSATGHMPHLSNVESGAKRVCVGIRSCLSVMLQACWQTILMIVTFFLQVHVSAAHGLAFTRTGHVMVCYLSLQLFAPFVSTVLANAPPWPHICIWYAFLLQYLWFGNETKSKVAFRWIIPIMFVIEGVSHPSFLLDLNGGELLIVSFVILLLGDNRTILNVSLLLLVSSQTLLALTVGSSPYIQWGVLVTQLGFLNHAHQIHDRKGGGDIPTQQFGESNNF